MNADQLMQRMVIQATLYLFCIIIFAYFADPDSIINILLVGAGDVRHIMRTVSENPNTSFHVRPTDLHQAIKGLG